MPLRLAFSGSENGKGSPYIKMGPNNYLIFSACTKTDKGYKYLIYSNSKIDNEDKYVGENLNFITTMNFRGDEENRSMGIPGYFRRNPYFTSGVVGIIQDFIGKRLTDTGEFPETAFPLLAEDFVKWNTDNPNGTEVSETPRKGRKLSGRKPGRPKVVKNTTEETPSEVPETPKKKRGRPAGSKNKTKKVKTVKKVKKVKTVKKTKRVRKAQPKVKKTRKTRADKGKKRTKKGRK